MKKCFWNILIAIIAIPAVFLFNSCTAVLYTSIDVLRPAKASFDDKAENLLIVNNAAVQPSTTGHKTWLINDTERTIDVSTDSLSMLLVSVLSEEIADRGFFAGNRLIYETQNTTSAYNTAKPLRSYQAANLCEQHQADVVLSLNKLTTTSLLEEFYLNDYSYFLSLDVVYNSEWSIQYPYRAQMDTLQFTDTVHWENNSYSRRLLFENFPRRSDALKNGALYVGRKSVNRFIPYWEEQNRYFFDVKDKQMRQGMDSVYAKQWAGAIKIWEDFLSTAKNKTAAYAANNLAVVYEITGNPDKALEYITAAIDSYSNRMCYDAEKLYRMTSYRDNLIVRKRETLLVEEQLGD
jgi:tetratricopeptide (TPR) repeat protein